MGKGRKKSQERETRSEGEERRGEERRGEERRGGNVQEVGNVIRE
jgi:hypothetical protein